MADAGKNAITTLNGDGTALNAPTGFVFLEESHILVEVDDGGGFDTLVLNSDYTVNASTTIITFLDSGPYGKFPPSGTDNVRFTRQTPHPTPYVTFTDGASVTAENLDNAIRQCLYYTEEVEDLT
jgi:hypothetical protein